MARLRPFFLLTLGILAGTNACVAAGLKWERETIDAALPPGCRTLHVDFPFRNVGDRDIRIISLDSSCRCTSAYTAKNSYAPGEKDVVGVDFAAGGQTGTVEKSVTVTTDGPEPTPVILSLRVRILTAVPAK